MLVSGLVEVTYSCGVAVTLLWVMSLHVVVEQAVAVAAKHLIVVGGLRQRRLLRG